MTLLLEFVNSYDVRFLFLFRCCVVELIFCVTKSCLLINLSDFSTLNGIKVADSIQPIGSEVHMINIMHLNSRLEYSLDI